MIEHKSKAIYNRRPLISVIYQRIAAEFNIRDKDEFRTSVRDRASIARQMFCHKAYQIEGYSKNEVAMHFGSTEKHVFVQLERFGDTVFNPLIKTRYERICKLIDQDMMLHINKNEAFIKAHTKELKAMRKLLNSIDAKLLILEGSYK
jgi:hypothetical protein